jgi:hypothetical protein
VANRADTADPGSEDWHFPEDLSFTEFFKAAELSIMEPGRYRITSVIQLDCYFPVSLDSGNWVNFNYFARHFSPL